MLTDKVGVFHERREGSASSSAPPLANAAGGGAKDGAPGRKPPAVAFTSGAGGHGGHGPPRQRLSVLSRTGAALAIPQLFLLY